MKTSFTTLLFACALGVSAQNPNPIRVNQVGYETLGAKTAAIEHDGWAKSYSLTDARGHRVWKGKVTRTAISPWSGKQRAIVDFSSVTTPGTYTLKAGRHKQQIVIADHPYADLSRASLRAFYLLRSGEALTEEYADEYARPLGHPDTHVMVHPSAASATRPAGTIISCPGGWYDAGDYNKYIVNSAYSVGLMLCAYEMQESYFSKLDTNIPPTDIINGIEKLGGEPEYPLPPMLEEIAVNLCWMLTMQDPEDGGVYHKLTTPNFEGFVMPTDCHQQRYVVMKSTAAALDFAATMAKASRIYRKYSQHRKLCGEMMEKAEKAYQWAMEHPDVRYRQDEMNRRFAPAVSTGTYGDEKLYDEWFWASVELYLTTGNAAYLSTAQENMQMFSAPSWPNVGGLAYYSAVAAFVGGRGHEAERASSPYADEIRALLRKEITNRANTIKYGIGMSCFDSPCGNSPSDFGWGCNSEQGCGKGIALLYAYALTGDKAYLNAARQAADYILGRNATGYCFVTGFGTYSPRHPHMRLSEADGIDAPLPGFLVGGPNPGQQDIAQVKHYPSDYPDESYSDTMQSYASNEIAINWNAALVALIGWLDAESGR